MYSFGIGFGLFEIMFVVVFCIVIGTFIVIAVNGIRTWHKNENSPELTVQAKVVSKRMNVSHHMNNNTASSSSTTYYVTFEVPSGDRMELRVYGNEYGLLAEGDNGSLTFQGTRYKSFKRM